MVVNDISVSVEICTSNMANVVTCGRYLWSTKAPTNLGEISGYVKHHKSPMSCTKKKTLKICIKLEQNVHIKL